MEDRESRSWIVQDLFSSGLPAPGFTTHLTHEDAMLEAIRRNGQVVKASRCEACGSLLGVDRMPLQGGCSDCR